jgi:DNA-binding GntR family transcriptional regulator
MIPEMTQTAYKALAAELRDAILAGEFPPDHQLPTEVELSTKRGLSRQTVRQAFQQLVSESLVYRVRGRGTFAAPVAHNNTYLRAFGSIDDLLALSLDTQLEVIEPLVPRTDASAAGRLQLPTDQVIAGMVRRTHDGVVFCSTRIALPVDIGRKVAADKELTKKGSKSWVTVIGLIERVAGVPIAGAHQSITAVPASATVAQSIECEVAEPVLQIDRLYFDPTGRLVELAVTHFHPDRYSYRLDIRRSPF